MITKSCRILGLALIAAVCFTGSEIAAESPVSPLSPALIEDARQALKHAATVFREQVSVEGSYVWEVSPDLTFRAGEALTDDRQGWVQPPGTPAVGQAFLAAYEATGDVYYWQAALEAGRALAKTQLVSGGWNALMEFDPTRREAWCYRLDAGTCDAKGPRHDNRDRDGSLLDDDITQSALRFLIILDTLGDMAADGDMALIAEAAAYGLNRLLQDQYPNGAWPVRLDRRVSRKKIKAKIGEKARYPADWSRTYPGVDETEFFILNDHLMSNTIRTLLFAHQHYGDGRFLRSAIRGGDFLLAAQLPAPQSGWAHNYNSAMEPKWARKFEPPALASWETASTISVLMDLDHYTGLERFWQALEPAVAWLERVRIGNDLWSRFYELETDKPLYMTSDYVLTYDDGDLPAHYGFRDDFGIPALLAAYSARQAARGGPTARPRPLPDAKLAAEVEAIIGSLDAEGRWIEDDRMLSATFVDHVETLARAIALASGRRIRAHRLFLPSGS